MSYFRQRVNSMTLLSNTDFFPTIFKILDANAIKAQRLFFRLLILDVILLILIPASILATSFYISSTTFRVIPILLIFIVFSINIVWPTPKLVKNWQAIRSAAESVKKEYMIYSVACPPYQIKNDQDSKEKLISVLAP
jgi:cytochrome c biogenesis factor